MARRTQIVAISAEGRDLGKTFLLREMPASQSEKWAARAFLALARSGVEIPDDIQSAGLAGIASVGLKAFGGMNFFDAEPLLDEMFACIFVIPDPARPQVVRALVEDDIEEVATRLKLRMEIFTLHTGFSIPAARSISGGTAGMAGATPNTETSLAP
jgi:hypothetical protein